MTTERYENSKALVSNEVGICMSDIIEFILGLPENTENIPFTHYDIENLNERLIKDGQMVYRIEAGGVPKFYSLDEYCKQKLFYEVTSEDAIRLSDNGIDLSVDGGQEVYDFLATEEEPELQDEQSDGDHALYGGVRIRKWDEYVSVLEDDDEPETEEGDSQDIMEWWAVSSWLADQLRDQGEPVLNTGMNWAWGRCATGQAIYMDESIVKIANA
jgi:hypothetical protein